MSIENCTCCGENTRDTDYDLESGHYINELWHCNHCFDRLPLGVRSQILNEELIEYYDTRPGNE